MRTPRAKGFVIAGAVALLFAVALLVSPIRASSGDGSHDCGSLIVRHPAELRRKYCEERKSYRNREAWVLVFGAVGSGCLVVAGSRWSAGSLAEEA